MKSGVYLSPEGLHIRLIETFICIDRWITVDTIEFNGVEYSSIVYDSTYKNWHYLGEL